MKKLITILLISSIGAFSASNSEIEKKLNFLIKKMNQMEKKLNSKDKEIETLKKEVKKQKVETKKRFTTQSCTNIKVSNLNFTYHKEVIPYYNLSYTLTNKYPYTIKKIAGKVKIKDNDGVTVMTDYIAKENVNLPKNGTLNIKKVHTVESELEKTMNEETPATLKLTFIPTQIIFTNGEQVSCGGIFNTIF